MRRFVSYLVVAVLLSLTSAIVAEAFPSQIQEREKALAWIVGGTLVATFPKTMEKDLRTFSDRFNRQYREGFALSDLRVADSDNHWHISLKGTVLLPVTASACRFHRSGGKMLAALWLSNLHEALAYLASPQQRKPVTLGGRNWMEGRVSWYGGSRWRGKRTASGEVFDDRQLTAAAVDLPFGTLVRLSNKRNGRSVVVRVTDRFGGLKGRLLDISQAAAEVLGIKGQGVAKLTIEILGRTARVGGN